MFEVKHCDRPHRSRGPRTNSLSFGKSLLQLPETQEELTPPGPRENIDLVRRVYALELDWSDPGSLEPTVAALRELLDPEVVFVPEAGRCNGVAYTGIAAYVELLADSSTHWESCRYVLEDLVAVDDDRILATGWSIARPRGGDAVDLPFATVWTVRAGRAARIESYADRSAALAAIR